MEPLHLKDEEALFAYLTKFLKDKPKAVQLDGATATKPNKRVCLVFDHSVTGRTYKLLGQTTRKSIQRFVSLTEEHGDAAVVLKEYGAESGETCLILATDSEPNGWLCLHYVRKANSRTHHAA